MRQRADSLGCRPSVQGPPTEAWASFGKRRDHLENLRGIPCMCVCVGGVAIPWSPFLAPSSPTKSTVTSQGHLYPRGRSHAGIQAPSVPPPRLRHPCSGCPGRPGHLRGLATTSALSLPRPRGGSAPPQARSAICRCPEEGMSVWMGAVQLSGRPCQSRATAQSPPPCPPTRPWETPVTSRDPSPLLSIGFGAWTLHHLSLTPPPAPTPPPGLLPEPQPLRPLPAWRSARLRPRFEPASAAA